MYVGLTPYSPLAAGRLSRAWNESTARYETDTIAQNKYGTNNTASSGPVLHKEPMVSTVIGSYRMSHLEDAANAVPVRLSPEEMTFLKELYMPHPIQGHH